MKNLTLAIFLSLTLYSCYSQDTKQIVKTNLDSFIEEPHYTRKRSDLTGEKAINTANKIYNGELFIWPGYEEVKVQYPIDWSIDPFNDNSWKNYFHSLRMITYLTDGYKASKNKKYLKLASEIVLDYFSKFKYNKGYDRKVYSKYPWYDHTVANRVTNVTYFLENYKEVYSENREVISEIILNLYEHTVWLDEANNFSDSNHGIMQAINVLQSSLIFNFFPEAEKWKRNSLQIILDQYRKDVSAEGVHLENSPGYHPFAMNLLKDTQKILMAYGLDLPDELKNIYESMKNYLVYVIKPNRHFPMIGDTGGKSTFTANVRYEGEYLDYISTNGEIGTKPDKTSIIYPEAGYAIFRDEWKQGNEYDKTTYINFTNGFYNTTHKHADLLSFVLYSNGEDLLIDPGLYSYTGSPIRNYIISALAHNTITINNESYKLRGKEYGNATFPKHEVSQNLDFVLGEHTYYEGYTVNRGVYYIKPNYIFIHDKIVSDTEKEFSVQEIFNLAPSFNALDVRNDTIIYKFKYNNLKLKSFNQPSIIKNYRGEDESKNVKAVYSESNNQFDEHQQAVLNFEDNTATFENYILLEIDNNYFKDAAKNFQLDQVNRMFQYTKDGQVHKQVIYEFE